MSLADAQSLAIRKLLSKSAYDSNIAPGPPLPKSHPSPALIAKLHLECASLYSSALSLAKTQSASASSKSKDGDGEVTVDLRRYLGDEVAFHGALARKWLGVDAGENGRNEKGGEAVGYLGWAKKELGMGAKGKEGKERRKEKVLDELDGVNVFLKHYRKLNDSVSLVFSSEAFEWGVIELCYEPVAAFPACSYTNGSPGVYPSGPTGGSGQALRASSAGVWSWLC